VCSTQAGAADVGSMASIEPARVNHVTVVDPGVDCGAAEKQAAPEPPPYKRVILVTTSVFMGYAALVTLQHKLKDVHDETHHPEDSAMFKHASTLNYVGNLIFRIAHNFFFAFLSPRQRVHASLLSMAAATGTLAFAMCIGRSPWIGWVFLSYFLGGVGVGTFESNLLASISPLGHQTKKWAILGMPLGFNLISVGGFLLMQAGVPLVALYLTVLVSCFASMLVFHLGVPARPTPTASPSLAGPLLPAADGGSSEVPALSTGLQFARFRADVASIGSWCPRMAAHTLALMCDMCARRTKRLSPRALPSLPRVSQGPCCAWTSSTRDCRRYCVSFFSSIMLYLFNDSAKAGQVALLGPNTTRWLVPHDAYFAVYNCFTFFGDTLSRQLVYRAARLYHPCVYLAFSAVGAALCLIHIPLVAPLGIFCIFFANGAVYATSTKHIDTNIDRRVGLTALSVWLFIGDIGSVLGSNTWEYIAPLVCSTVPLPHPHMCVVHNSTHNSTHG
jgi:hypothetical protein